MVMRVELPILAGHCLMATDMIESMGHELLVGNDVTINTEPDTRAETDRLYAALSEGGTEGSGMADMFWGAHRGSCLDRFGARWMFNCTSPAPSRTPTGDGDRRRCVAGRGRRSRRTMGTTLQHPGVPG